MKLNLLWCGFFPVFKWLSGTVCVVDPLVVAVYWWPRLVFLDRGACHQLRLVWDVTQLQTQQAALSRACVSALINPSASTYRLRGTEKPPNSVHCAKSTISTASSVCLYDMEGEALDRSSSGVEKWSCHRANIVQTAVCQSQVSLTHIVVCPEEERRLTGFTASNLWTCSLTPWKSIT